MDVLTLSRIQFGGTAAFHIIWPVMSIGLAFFMFVMEAMWLKTNNEQYYRQTRFWTKIFTLTFAIGVATGFPLAFQFGTNWAAFSATAGSFVGNMIGFETTIAFTLETTSLGILIFGWNRVPRYIHLMSNFLVLVGASLSTFWIMVANSWMQVTIGTHFQNGMVIVDDYLHAILNPETFVSFTHMLIACIETTLFMIGGIAATQLLRKSIDDKVRVFFLHTFRYILVLALIITPLQIVIGDLSGLVVSKYQPAKLAATELHWDTNTTHTGASWSLIAFPNTEANGNSINIAIPHALSLIIKHSEDGEVQGLNDFPKENRPSATQATVIFYAFRIMLAIGVFLFVLTLYGGWIWRRGKMNLRGLSTQKWYLHAWIFAIPLGFIATEAGWIVREIGRQPWVIYNHMRVSEALSSNLNASVVGISLTGIIIIYTVLIVCFIYFTIRIVKMGPDLTSQLPEYTKS